MTNQYIQAITSANLVAELIMQYSAHAHIVQAVLSLYDNLRSDYSPAQQLEIGGIALTEEKIVSMLRLQSQYIAKCAGGHRRIVLFWKEESARLYANGLKREISETSNIEVLLSPIRTKWISNQKADVVSGVLPTINELDYIICADFMCGSGGTMVALDDWLEVNLITADIHVVLVDAISHERSDKVPPFIDPRFIWDEPHWLIGFNSDCPIDGRCEGREIPFLAFLKPCREGIRTELRAAFERRTGK